VKKAFKLVFAAVVGLVVLLAVAIALAMYFIDSIARKGIEDGSSYALAVPTSLDSADVGIFSGSFEMSGLTVSNPEGFDTPHFLELGAGGVEVELGTLRKDLVELPRLTLSDIDIHIQQRGGTSNVSAILANLKRFESPDTPKTDKSTGQAKRFIVHELRIEDVNVHVTAAPLGGQGVNVDLAVPQIVMNDIGSETGKGVLLGELADIIVKALVSAIRDAGGGIIPGDLLGQLDAGLADLESLEDLGIEIVNDLGQQATEKLNEASEQVEKAVDDLKEEGEKAVEGLKDLLKKPGGGG